MAFRGLFTKLKEAVLSVAPITFIIFALVIFFIPTEMNVIIKLAISAVIMIVGVAFFSLGADNAMIELGSGAGATLSRKNKLLLMLLTGFLIGFAVTVAEPDLMVLAKQVEHSTSLNSAWMFVSVVSLGVGILFMLGILRIYFKMNLSVLLSVCYGIIIVLSFFVPKNFVPIAFDSGSVTTGAISVPFLISFGVGLSAVRSKRSEDDSFGLIALCSVGPIIAVMILSLFIGDANITASAGSVTYASVSEEFLAVLGASLRDVAITLSPIVIMFVIFQVLSFKFPATKVVRTIIGFLLTYVGIALFFTGVECGYLPLGRAIGVYFASLGSGWIAIIMAFMLGAFAIIAEPAMQVLKKQVEDITNKAISQRAIMIFISLGVAFSVAISVTQVLFGINFLYIVVPFYIACIVLTFIVPKVFTAIAFDSGGVASGTMAVSFILPFVTGLSASGNGFGTVAMIALFPIFAIQIMGLIYQMKLSKLVKKRQQRKYTNNDIIEFDYPREKEKGTGENIVEFEVKD